MTDELTYDPDRELTYEEGHELFDRQTRRILGVTAKDFLDAYDRGEAYDRWDNDDVACVVMLFPFIGRDLDNWQVPPTRSDTPRQPVIATRSANAKM